MKENQYFKRYEFECRCGKCQLPSNVPSDELITILTEIREHFGQCLRINSGYRCPEHNARVGGAKSSQHVAGSAADFIVFNSDNSYEVIDVKGLKTKEYTAKKKVFEDKFNMKIKEI